MKSRNALTRSIVRMRALHAVVCIGSLLLNAGCDGRRVDHRAGSRRSQDNKRQETVAQKKAAETLLKSYADRLADVFRSGRVREGRLRKTEFTRVTTADVKGQFEGTFEFEVVLLPLENDRYYQRWVFDCLYKNDQWLLRTMTTIPEATADADKETKRMVALLDPMVKDMDDVPLETFFDDTERSSP